MSIQYLFIIILLATTRRTYQETFHGHSGHSRNTVDKGEGLNRSFDRPSHTMNHIGSNDHEECPHVIVVGGGPAGLMTSILLRQRGITVTVLEKFPEHDQWSNDRSHSINLNGRGRTALLKAGILDEIMGVSTLRTEIVVYDGASGRITATIPKYPPDMALSRPSLTSALEKVLLNRYQTQVLRNCCVKELVLNRDDGKLEVLLKDGKSFIGTHIIGSDGKWSAVRESVPFFSKQASLNVEPSWGVHMTAQEIPSKWRKTSTVIFKPRKEAKFYIICAPLPCGKCSITMVCFDETLERYPWLEPPSGDNKNWISQRKKVDFQSRDLQQDKNIELVEKLEQLLKEELPAFFENCFDMETLETATIHPRVSWLDMSLYRDTNEISTENKIGLEVAQYATPGGRIALVGDACHACTPSLGEGCNLALESAVALGEAIDSTSKMPNKKITSSQLSEAIVYYGSTRPAGTRPVQASSTVASKLS